MTKTKLQLRAEAVERLRECRYHTLADYVRAMLGWGHEPHFEDSRDALIDLLTDDCGPCYSCAKLAELVAENNALRAANDMKATESDVRTLGIDANDANVDTREKLEADIIQRSKAVHTFLGDLREGFKVVNVSVDVIRGWLDRQAAITERHILTHPDERDEQIAELQAAYDELTAIAAQLCRACGFSMVDASGEVVE